MSLTQSLLVAALLSTALFARDTRMAGSSRSGPSDQTEKVLEDSVRSERPNIQRDRYQSISESLREREQLLRSGGRTSHYEPLAKSLRKHERAIQNRRMKGH